MTGCFKAMQTCCNCTCKMTATKSCRSSQPGRLSGSNAIQPAHLPKRRCAIPLRRACLFRLYPSMDVDGSGPVTNLHTCRGTSWMQDRLHKRLLLSFLKTIVKPRPEVCSGCCRSTLAYYATECAGSCQDLGKGRTEQLSACMSRGSGKCTKRGERAINH